MADTCKTEAGICFPEAAFAYTPDDTPSHWKLRLWEDLDKKATPAQVGRAAAAFSPGGYRGNKVEIPSSDIAAVKAKVRAAWQRVNPDKDSSEMPAAIKAAETPDETWQDLRLGDPTGTDLYVPAPIGSVSYTKRLTTLVQKHLNTHGVLTSEDHEKLKKVARGHAGGTAKAARAKQAGEVVLQEPYGMPDDDHDEDDGWYKLAKNDPAVNYRDSAIDPDAAGDTGNPDPDNDDDVDYCGSCRFFHYGTCALVEGAIDADDLCDLHRDQLVLYIPPQGETFAEPASLRPERGIGRDGTRFLAPVDLGSRTFAGTASEWVQFLPPPGKYAHSVYGEIDLSREAVAGMLANFKANTYGQDLPINVEHDMRSAGAVGWIRDMRLAGDGSLEVKPEWNERGRSLIDGDRFRYVSAEFFESWQDPVTATWHDHVPVGMAICTRPHFKTNVLRPLAATDGNGLAPGASREGEPRMSDEKDAQQHEGGAKGVTLSEDQYREFQEAQRLLAELKAKTEAQEATLATERAAREVLAKENRRRRFTELVRGVGGTNDGAPWAGPWADNIARLELLADKVGEDDEFFKAYVADKQADARRLRESGIFGMVGSNQAPEHDGTPAGRLEEATRAKQLADPKLSRHQAMAQVLAESPQLYTEMIGGH